MDSQDRTGTSRLKPTVSPESRQIFERAFLPGGVEVQMSRPTLATSGGAGLSDETDSVTNGKPSAGSSYDTDRIARRIGQLDRHLERLANLFQRTSMFRFGLLMRIDREFQRAEAERKMCVDLLQGMGANG